MSKLCCVYQIQNIRSGYKYVGGTINYVHRRRQHLSDLSNNRHYSKALQKDFLDLGKNFFIFSVLEDATKETLDSLKSQMILLLDPKKQEIK